MTFQMSRSLKMTYIDYVNAVYIPGNKVVKTNSICKLHVYFDTVTMPFTKTETKYKG